MKNIPHNFKLKTSILFAGIGAIAVFTAVILGLKFFSEGQVTVSGAFPDPYTADALTCESSSFVYPFFSESNPTKSNTKFNISFGKDSIDAISMISTRTYASASDAEAARNLDQAAMNGSYNTDHLGADALGVVYSQKGSTLNISLYATTKDLTGPALKYFLLENTKSTDYTSKNLSAFFNKKGFNCTINQ